MTDFILTAKQLQQNYKTFRQLINDSFPSRKDALNIMYDDLGDERVIMAPASSFEFFHNAIPGGYVDHILRVYEYSIDTYELWKKHGLAVNTFSIEELVFSAIHHDLGKLGLPGARREHYVYNDSKWHRENQGKMYKSNPNVPNMTVTDKGFFLLNHYQIPITENEWIGIRCTDGMYEEANKPYLSGFNLDTKLRNPMPYILHQADIMAFRFEFERWAKITEKFTFSGAQTAKASDGVSEALSQSGNDLFDKMFG